MFPLSLRPSVRGPSAVRPPANRCRLLRITVAAAEAHDLPARSPALPLPLSLSPVAQKWLHDGLRGLTEVARNDQIPPSDMNGY